MDFWVIYGVRVIVRMWVQLMIYTTRDDRKFFQIARTFMRVQIWKNFQILRPW